ncbi:MAG: ATP:cob(I)alamin adenosyltransferase [Elusimicrobia bacterium]|nr:ATP:cob(I)alamin adenosyltransferase [Elusimicrobiota bacterium]
MSANYKPKPGSGDNGFTDLFGGKRVGKTDLRVRTNALIDELASLLGVIKSGLKSGKSKQEIAGVQGALVAVSGFIAGAAAAPEIKAAVSGLEALIAGRSKYLPPLKKFILPGKNKTEALVHLARSRARLCELLAWRLKMRLPAVYLNRLSDYLFLLARKNL